MFNLLNYYRQRYIIYCSILSRIFFYFNHFIAPYCSTFLTSIFLSPSPFYSLWFVNFYNFYLKDEICSCLILGSIFSYPIIFPSRTLRTLWERYFKFTSWVTITRVIFSVSFNLRRISNTICVFLVSRSPVGSSRRRTWGLFARDRAIVTLCC